MVDRTSGNTLSTTARNFCRSSHAVALSVKTGEVPSRRLHLGVDTGGTFTDAALLDALTHQVLTTAKSLTTKDDLALGVNRAITAAVSDLPEGLTTADIALVSVSTTLATNAVVEGHGDQVGAVFIGFSDDMVARTGVAKGFPGVPIIRIAGGHNHAGNEQTPLDEQAITDAISALDDSIRAIAICSAFAVRNPDHEKRARELIGSLTTVPVTLSGELSSGLDAPRRALTSVLNARLIGRAHTLITSVQRAMGDLGLNVPLMLVKGDGSRALASSVAQRPIETVLSGPAASMVGAGWLSGLSDFIMSDIGGTTTDVGIVENGRMVVSDNGAEVGGWRTMVRAGDLRTLGLGGDSDVSLDGRRVIVGPQRVVPLSLLVSKVPSVRALLAADLADERTGGASHGRFVLSPSAISQGDHAPTLPASLSDGERAMLTRIGTGVLPYRLACTSSRDSRVLESLRKLGLAQVAAFTPTDAAHVLGQQETFDTHAAHTGALLLARLRMMGTPGSDDAVTMADDVWNETVRASTSALISTLLAPSDPPLGANDGALLDAICRGQSSQKFVRLQITSSLPIVAVGGPAKVFYDEVANRLGTTVTYPPHWSVANAVGAATGVVSRSVVVTIETTGEGFWSIHSASGREQATDPTQALTRAREIAEQSATEQVRALGAEEPTVTTTVKKSLLPGFNPDGDMGLLSARITSEAVAAPRA
jgi:N-methylhydantoinase A/oxoprolinase/acetone carboxylase beta subunit